MGARAQSGLGVMSVVIALLLIVGLVVAYFWATLSWSYSSGDRAGWVQKFSRKG